MKHRMYTAGFKPVRHDRLLQEREHDTYKLLRKLAEPTVCPQCGAVWQGGRWMWAATPAEAERHTCPACHRIADNLPAGFVLLSGAFFEEHREEILRLVANEEARERAEHALQRIMSMERMEDGAELVTTTDIHLARRIGEAVHAAWQGDLSFHYNDGEKLLRVHWSR